MQETTEACQLLDVNRVQKCKFPPRKKIKDKVTRLWIAALAPMPTVVDLSPCSASHAVVTVERQRAPGNETLLGWRASPKKMKMKEK